MKMIFRVIAIIGGKIAIYLSRLLGNQGTDFPGKLARKIYGQILSDLAENITKQIIIITGTNGKTTTTNMVARILTEDDSTFIHNQAGANMITGITTAFIEKANLIGTREFDYAILETDEANVPLILKEIKADILLITNFFRDQLDRFGELDHTIDLIKNAVTNTDVRLVLNADDPLVSNFPAETGLSCQSFGFAETQYDNTASSESREGRYCVCCGHELAYERYHYAQLGKYYCPSCGSHNPERDFTAHNLTMNPTIRLRVDDVIIESPYQGFYNAYNVLAAVSLTKIIGISEDIIEQAIYKFEPQAGRMETFNINGKKTILILVKNPTGLDQTLSMLLDDPNSKNLFIALNDNAADGRDISWIWDAEVEVITDSRATINKIICAGLRSGDMAVRVKYCSFNPQDIIITSSLQEGIEKTINSASEVSYILSTYTALFECRKILVKMQKEGEPALPEDKEKQEVESE